MMSARTLIIGAVLALGVALLGQGLVRLVDASGAQDQPAVVLVLLLSAFLGLLTAVLTRALDVPGFMAPTVLVVGWIVVPPILGLFPVAAAEAFAGGPALNAGEAASLAVAVISASVTLGVSRAHD
jgi:hypothetical protein